ncbi:MAG: 50S ribosomal protein L21 [Thermaerobacterales bacterium]
MYAIIETGGKQYRVTEGDVLRVERLSESVDSDVEFDRVLALGNGEDLRLGTPTISEARVTGRVLDEGREKKIMVFRYRPKKRWRKLRGHRQHYSRIRIEKIEA